ncbi:hypothetical protein C0Q70_14623 [Pomacea canaliculata]|uniref:Uncharacterized protein n=1 Tax=Pomacea canaliculata TaxID=400727 RepID=A0A2T7NSN2_POMCA|nr:hypothetical protein C0Q70_14623 [Pomacea canaliculata]
MPEDSGHSRWRLESPGHRPEAGDPPGGRNRFTSEGNLDENICGIEHGGYIHWKPVKSLAAQKVFILHGGSSTATPPPPVLVWGQGWG